MYVERRAAFARKMSSDENVTPVHSCFYANESQRDSTMDVDHSTLQFRSMPFNWGLQKVG
jgi:hypothetical protein